jgi:hypothetical protein
VGDLAENRLRTIFDSLAFWAVRSARPRPIGVHAEVFARDPSSPREFPGLPWTLVLVV